MLVECKIRKEGNYEFNRYGTTNDRVGSLLIRYTRESLNQTRGL